ncbi:MAG: 50S ribosomal protein L3, partial [Treponema sp.]|nr:50S ribosomal protein L3 [Treponema sp.]
MVGLLARKLGMTQVFDEQGNLTPVTVMKAGPNVVIAQKTVEKDGYKAVVVGIDDEKESRASKPYAGQFPEGVSLKKKIRELRDFEKDAAVGSSIGVEVFE